MLTDAAALGVTRVKSRIHDLFQQDRDFTEEDIHQLNPTGSISVAKALSRLSECNTTGKRQGDASQGVTSAGKRQGDDTQGVLLGGPRV